MHIVIQILLFIALLAADRITKLLAVRYLKGQDAVPIIKDVIELRYLENSGAAFGMFQNMQWMFYIITAIILVVIVILFISLNKKLNAYCDLYETDPGSFQLRTYKSIIFFNYLILLPIKIIRNELPVTVLTLRNNPVFDSFLKKKVLRSAL